MTYFSGQVHLKAYIVLPGIVYIVFYMTSRAPHWCSKTAAILVYQTNLVGGRTLSSFYSNKFAWVLPT